MKTIRTTILPNVMSVSQEEILQFSGEYKNIKEMVDGKKWNHGIEKTHTWSTDKYTGRLTEELKNKINPFELSILLNDGFGYFGGESKIDDEGNFNVVIYVD